MLTTLCRFEHRRGFGSVMLLVGTLTRGLRKGLPFLCAHVSDMRRDLAIQ